MSTSPAHFLQRGARRPRELEGWPERGQIPLTDVLHIAVVSRPRRSGFQGHEHPLCSSQLTQGSCFLAVALPPVPAWGDGPQPHPGAWAQVLRSGEGIDSQPTPTAPTPVGLHVLTPSHPAPALCSRN